MSQRVNVLEDVLEARRRRIGSERTADHKKDGWEREVKRIRARRGVVSVGPDVVFYLDQRRKLVTKERVEGSK